MKRGREHWRQRAAIVVALAVPAAFALHGAGCASAGADSDGLNTGAAGEGGIPGVNDAGADREDRADAPDGFSTEAGQLDANFAPSGDSCVEPLTLAPEVGKPATIDVDTATMNDDYTSYCTKGGDLEPAPDVVVAISPTLAPGTGGTLTVTAARTAGSAILYTQSECGQAETVLSCGVNDLTTSTQLAVAAGDTVYAVAETPADDPGGVQISASLAPAVCGDGALNVDEGCDFGDTEPDDGCDPDCQFEPPADSASDKCPGRVASDNVSSTNKYQTDGFTIGYGDDYDAPCSAADGAPDRVYAVTVLESGTLRVTVDASFDAVVSVYDDCMSEQLVGARGCSDASDPSATEVLDVSVTASQRYLVVIDGFNANSMGTFSLTAELVAGGPGDAGVDSGDAGSLGDGG